MIFSLFLFGFLIICEVAKKVVASAKVILFFCLLLFLNETVPDFMTLIVGKYGGFRGDDKNRGDG